MTTLPGIAAAVTLAVVHLAAGRIRTLEGIPRSRWLSAAGGVSVAYVFIHLLPELARGQEALARAGAPLGWIEQRSYLLALMGLAVFYGLERYTTRSRGVDPGHRKGDASETEPGAFWVSTASFAVYNLLIGYLLLHRSERPLQDQLMYTVAMALHFVVNDFGLREHHKRRYQHTGRWVLSAAIVAGAALGLLTSLPEALVAAVTAFLAGGIVLNVLKEELPGHRRSRFWAFAAGTAAYAGLLIAMSAVDHSHQAQTGSRRALHPWDAGEPVVSAQ